MSTQTTTQEEVDSWELSDDLWEKMDPLLPKPKSRFRGRGRKRRNIGGRPPADRRTVMAGILYVLRTGCQWNAASKAVGLSGKTLHRYFQKWRRAGVFKRMWQAGLREYDQAKGIAWTWQAADGVMTKAPLGGGATGPNPTDRAKCGTKRSLLTDARGAPLGIVVSGANRHDSVLLGPTLEAVVIPRPLPTEAEPQHLCLDQAYVGQPCEETATAQGYILHRSSGKKTAEGEALPRSRGKKARRWVVEVAHSWLNRFRRLLVRWEKKPQNYLSMLYFACAIICWRKAAV